VSVKNCITTNHGIFPKVYQFWERSTPTPFPLTLLLMVERTVNYWGEIVVLTTIRYLDPVSLHLWDQFANRNLIPTFKQLIDFPEQRGRMVANTPPIKHKFYYPG
jgi:hypothetical protein